MAGGPGRIVVHPLPLARHADARAAAHAALAARRLGNETGFVDALLARHALGVADLRAAAAIAGLPAARFEAERVSAGVRAQVERERRAAIAFGVRATPSALLVGRGVSGLPSRSALPAALAAAIVRWRACQTASTADCEADKVGAGGPTALAAFQNLRRAEASTAAAATGGGVLVPAAPGHLGTRWRVTLPNDPFQLPGSPDAIAVWFVDPADPGFSRSADVLLRAARAGRVRLVLVPITGAKAPLTPALAVHGALAALTQAQREPRLHALLASVDPQASGLGRRLGMTAKQVTAAAATTQAVVRLEAALQLAQQVAAEPGSLFLNGRRWHGRLDDPALNKAMAMATAEAKALTQMLGSERYIRLVANGRSRSQAEADLGPMLPPSALDGLADLGHAAPPSASGVVHAWLLVDFRRMGSRAAFYALLLLRAAANHPVHLHVAAIAPSRRAASPASVALLIAARHGKAVACARRLFGLANPSDQRQLRRLYSAIGLDPRLLVSDARHPAIRAAAAATATLQRRYALQDAPVMYLGGRRYVGPIDENRITAAVAFVSAHPESRP